MIRRTPRSTRTDTLCPATTLSRSFAAQDMLLPQGESLVGWQLGQNDDGCFLPGAQRREVPGAVGDGLELDAFQEQQLAVPDEQHLVGDVAEIGRAHV